MIVSMRKTNLVNINELSIEKSKCLVDYSRVIELVRKAVEESEYEGYCVLADSSVLKADESSGVNNKESTLNLYITDGREQESLDVYVKRDVENEHTYAVKIESHLNGLDVDGEDYTAVRGEFNCLVDVKNKNVTDIESDLCDEDNTYIKDIMSVVLNRL